MGTAMTIGYEFISLTEAWGDGGISKRILSWEAIFRLR
jgi:hypothetical protein